jgi:hypothetical protein
MSNVVTGTTRRIDTFGSDVVIDTKIIEVFAIYITAYTSAKTITFIDNDAAVVLVLEVAAGSTAQITPAKPIKFSNGLTFDDSASDLAAGDFIFIFGKE